MVHLFGFYIKIFNRDRMQLCTDIVFVLAPVTSTQKFRTRTTTSHNLINYFCTFAYNKQTVLGYIPERSPIFEVRLAIEPSGIELFGRHTEDEVTHSVFGICYLGQSEK